MAPSAHEQDRYSETDRLLRTAVDCALDAGDFAAALVAFRQRLPEVAPEFFSLMPPDEDARRGIALAVFRDIWRVLPRPDHGWRPLPLPRMERNGACPCGSGRKFKQCCGRMDAGSPFGGDGLSVLGHVLDRMPAARYRELPLKLLSPEELAHTASQWIEQDRHEEAIALLEPLLADAARLDARHEYAFDVLCDAYLDLDRQDERRALVENMMRSSDRELRSAAMHRRCTMFADQGDYPAAWQLFREAQRANADDPSLAHLELVLLAGQGEIERVGERARFWAARLRKLGCEGEELVDFIDDVARHPEGFAQAMKEHGRGMADVDALARLVELTEGLPAPACHYRLRPQDDSAGPLEPDASLSDIEQEWQGRINPADEDAWSETGWIDWLAAHPLAWQSFAVLEDVMMAVDDFEFETEEDARLLDEIEDALLDHAVKLLRLVIAEHRADALKLEWGWLENRAALGLLARYIELVAGTDEELPLLEWLVLTLNPNDNQGLRVQLVHVYAAEGRAEDALAVCDRYAGDAMGSMLYARVLALYLLGRRGDAIAALADAKKLSPRILKTLTAARPRRPLGLQPGIITVGGEDEAWFYRQKWRGVWEAAGAMAWLRQAAGVKP